MTATDKDTAQTGAAHAGQAHAGQARPEPAQADREQKDPQSTALTRAEHRKARLAAELRANLTKRKRQASARRSKPSEDDPDAA